MVVGKPERLVLGPVPAGPEPEDETAPAYLVHRYRHLGDHRRVVERRGRDQRPEQHTLGRLAQGGQSGPGLPRAPDPGDRVAEMECRVPILAPDTLPDDHGTVDEAQTRAQNRGGKDPTGIRGRYLGARRDRVFAGEAVGAKHS